MAPCPSDDQLRRLDARDLAPEVQTAIEAHVASCANCRARRAQLLADNEALARNVRVAFGRASRETESGAVPAAPGPSPDQPPRAPATPPELPEGYEFVREISRGGQGVVYQAIQTATKRKVAIKVLLEGAYASPSTLRRFEREIELVASLKHPNIVAVFHSGQTADGRPFCVMDYVRGVPLTAFVREQKLGMEDALKLFGQVCSAVQYAHQKGVIHRDLKPSNILVDADGHPKVLDFGLAKQVGGPEQTLISLTGQVVGTLPYMSPEQARGNPDEIDTRTDVYALGVILYEMLTGCYPYPVAGQMAEVLKHIAETEPTPPSRAWKPESGVVSRSSARRHRTGDCPIDDEVQTIVLRALAKERQRRYGSAGEFACDLDHYLAGEAIEARRDSGWYVLRKQLQRHRIPVAVVAGFMLVILIAAAVSSTMYVRAEKARLAESAERERAQQQTEIAQAVNDFLNQDLLAAAVPSTEAGKGVDVKMRDVLEEASKRIDAACRPGGRFHDKPLVEAAIRVTLANTFMALGLGAAAESHFARSKELCDRIPDLDGATPLRITCALANTYNLQGRYAEAEKLLVPTIAALERRQNSNSGELLRPTQYLAKAYLGQGRYQDAERLYRSALASTPDILDSQDHIMYGMLCNIAVAYEHQGKNEAARHLLEDSVSKLRAMLGVTDASTLCAMTNLGANYLKAARFDDARRVLEEAYEVKRRIYGPQHPEVLGLTCNLALAYSGQGNGEKAQQLLEASIEVEKAVLGPEHPDTLCAMQNLVGFYVAKHEYSRALSLSEHLLESFRRSLGPEHPQTLGMVLQVASGYTYLGRYDDAQQLLEEALSIRRSNKDWSRMGDTPSVASLLVQLADVVGFQGRHDDAGRLRREAFGQRLTQDPQDSEALFALAQDEFQGAAQDPETLTHAADLAERAAAANTTYAPHHRLLGEIRLAQNRPGDAEKAFRRALEIDGDTDEGLLWLALALCQSDQTAAARDTLAQAEQLIQADETDDPELAALHSRVRAAMNSKQLVP